MGAWGAGNFDNDTAADWAYGLEEADGLKLISRTIGNVFEEEYIDSDVGCEALAAAEALARVLGKGGEQSPYSESVDKWANDNKETSIPSELVEKAVQALDLIGAENSELRELWEESDAFDDWQRAISDLRSRLAGSVQKSVSFQ